MEFCCYSSENRTWKTYRILQYAPLTWTVILRNGTSNQRLNSLFPGSRTALQTLPLHQEQMARTTTTELTMFLGTTSREAKQSASLLECILISDCGDTFKASFFVFHYVSFHTEIGLALVTLVAFRTKPEYIGGPETS